MALMVVVVDVVPVVVMNNVDKVVLVAMMVIVEIDLDEHKFVFDLMIASYLVVVVVE